MATKKIESPEKLEILIDSFIQEVKAGNIPRPTDYNLVEFLGISASTLDRMQKGEDEEDSSANISYKGYDKPFKKLLMFREEFYLNQGDTMAVFALKQKKNGGYTDRQQESKEPIKLNVTINGAGNNPFG